MTHIERRRLWQQHIEDWQASGLSGMAYCQQQSLTYCRFVYWRKKLTEPEASFPEQPVSSPGFAKVSAVPGPESSEGLTVSLPGGVSITGLHAGNVELLGANGLALIVEQELGHSPFSGALYAFTNRQRNKIKCLMWEDNGFVLYYKSLAEEKFKWPGPSDELMPLNGKQINWLLDGYDITLLQGHKTLHYESVG